MADDDLIRRGDALKCCQTQRRGPAVAYEIAALPAQGDEAEKWKRAFAAQSQKLQAVLHIPGVKEELATLAESERSDK